MARNNRRLNRWIKAAQAKGEQITFLAAVEIQAADAETKKPPTFSVTAYNGGPLKVSGYPLPVVVDLAGLEYATSIVANLDHDQKQRVGHVTEPLNDGKSLTLVGHVSGTSGAAQEVLANAANGYPWQASIEALPLEAVEEVKAGKTVSVNGQTFKGPILVARKSKLYGFAFLSRGADESTTVTIAAAAAHRSDEMKPELRKFIEAAGFDADNITDTQLKWFTEQHEAEVQAAAKTAKKSNEQQTLDELLSREKANRDRVSKITQITAAAIQDNPQSIDSIEAMARLAIDGDWDTDRFELELLRATRPQAHGVFRARTDKALDAKVIEAALLLEGRHPTPEKHFDDQTLQAAHDKFRNGIGMRQLFQIAARANGYNDSYGSEITLEVQRYAMGMNPRQEIHAGFSTVNLPNILSNTANKFLTMGFNNVDQTYRALASTRSVRDFKQITTNGLSGDFTYEKMGASSEFKHATLGEYQYTNQAATYGRMCAITREDITNDDTGALTEVPMKLGRGAGLKINNVFWTTFLDNSTHFAAGNNNVSTGGGSALALAGLAAAEVVWYAQTDPDGNPLGIMPSILLVPPTLKPTALQLMESALLVSGSTTAAGDRNVWQGRYRVATSAYMENTSYTGYSTAAWYLLADPSELSTIEIVYLNGRDQPIVDTADAEFNVLGVQMRGYFDFGVSLQETRAGVRSAGS